MKLKEYLLIKRGNAALLAKAINSHAPDICRWAKDKVEDDFRPVPIDKCVAIEIATNGEVSRKDLRPDDWETIWPEISKENLRSVA